MRRGLETERTYYATAPAPDPTCRLVSATGGHIERAARVHGITLLGPVVADNSRQAKAGSGFAKSSFPVDWDRRQATCPQGALSREWRPLRRSGHAYSQGQSATALASPVRP